MTEPAQRWTAEGLAREAKGVSASRRTDIPALYARWFENRLAAGFAEYVPLGPPRRIRRSLGPADVTHFNFWSKWPRPFFGALERVLERGYPVLFNVTITGLGGTELEPRVPTATRVVEATEALATMLPAGAVAWRYDPIVVSDRLDRRHHRETFCRLLDRLGPLVDRVIVSLPTRYGRQVEPDLRAYERETGEALARLDVGAQAELCGELAERAAEAGLALCGCCSGPLCAELGIPAAGCNGFDWATRIYPELRRHRRLRKRPSRDGCTCSEEVDIGVYDTCVLGCRYSYGSRDLAAAERNHARHDPEAPCLVP